MVDLENDMDKQANVKSRPSEHRNLPKKSVLFTVLGFVNALGVILRLIDKAYEWWQKIFGDST